MKSKAIKLFLCTLVVLWGCEGDSNLEPEVNNPIPIGPASCFDQIINQGETNVDCGGPCPPCPPSCTDGILNQDEQAIDCGGTQCPPCVMGCTNPNAHNYNANAVLDDGSCQTCSDGIQNGDETNIDCGGLICDPCVSGCTNPLAHNYNPLANIDDGSCLTCSDGIQNGDETDIDCGGAICPPCGPPVLNPSMQADIDGITWTADDINVQEIANTLIITGNRTSDNFFISLVHDQAFAVGNYPIQVTGSQYVEGDQATYLCQSTTGSITFSTFDTVNRVIAGTFTFDCTVQQTLANVMVTNGSFADLSY